MEQELLPCPFCGRSAFMNHLRGAFGPDSCVVGCTNPNCDVSPSSEEHITEAAAIAAWNTRPGEKALVDALEEAAQSLETIAKGAGKQEFLIDTFDVRGYANSRANVARAALAARRWLRGGGKNYAAENMATDSLVKDMVA